MVCGLVVLTILNFSNLTGYRSGSPDLNVDRYVQYFCLLYHSSSTQTFFSLSLSLYFYLLQIQGKMIKENECFAWGYSWMFWMELYC